LRYCFGLPFLNSKDVGDCFAIDLAAIQLRSSKLTLFVDYLVDTYIAESSKFPPHIWAEDTSSLKRTTNACESFHSRFNSSFYHSHPNIFQFIRVLTDFQSDTYIKVRTAQQNEKKNYSSKTLQNKKNLDEKFDQLKNGVINNLEFIKIVGNHFKI
jgi:hypothetical protein